MVLGADTCVPGVKLRTRAHSAFLRPVTRPPAYSPCVRCLSAKLGNPYASKVLHSRSHLVIAVEGLIREGIPGAYSPKVGGGFGCQGDRRITIHTYITDPKNESA